LFQLGCSYIKNKFLCFSYGILNKFSNFVSIPDYIRLIILTNTLIMVAIIDENVTGHDYSNPDTWFFTTAQFFMGCLMLVAIFVGFIGNFVSIYVYTRPSMVNFINTLLIGLAMCDLVLLMAGLLTCVPLAFWSTQSAIAESFLVRV